MAVTTNTQIHESTRTYICGGKLPMVIEKHRLNDANTITSMKHKHSYVTQIKNTWMAPTRLLKCLVPLQSAVMSYKSYK